eukprot:COSAG03_NODE_4689_length_1465_cov_12.812592_2_plen_225_part_00
MPFRVSVSEDGLETGQSVPNDGPKCAPCQWSPPSRSFSPRARSAPISERARALCRRPRAAPAPPHAELQQLWGDPSPSAAPFLPQHSPASPASTHAGRPSSSTAVVPILGTRQFLDKQLKSSQIQSSLIRGSSEPVVAAGHSATCVGLCVPPCWAGAWGIGDRDTAAGWAYGRPATHCSHSPARRLFRRDHAGSCAPRRRRGTATQGSAVTHLRDALPHCGTTS